MFRRLGKRRAYSTTWRRITDVVIRLVIATITIILVLAGLTAAQEPATSRYPSANGLKMYYEINGSGKPILIIHGTISGSGLFFRTLAKERQVIAVKLQGHGHTGDIERPLAFGQIANNVGALLKEFQFDTADIFGYSMGGTVALYTAIKQVQEQPTDGGTRIARIKVL